MKIVFARLFVLIACLFAAPASALAADLVVTVADTAGKPVPSAVVTFSPAGATPIPSALKSAA